MADEWEQLEREAFTPNELDDLAEHLRSETMHDRELTEWLATNVLGATCEWHEVSVDYEYCNANGELFCPLESLDDCRLLEDRLRELGLAEAYRDRLIDVLLMVPGQLVGSTDLLFANPRQRCEAIKRTWEQHKKQPESPDS